MKRPRKRRQLTQAIEEFFLGTEATKTLTQQRRQKDFYIRTEEERYSFSNNEIKDIEEKRNRLYEKGLGILIVSIIILSILFSLNPNVLNYLSSSISKLVSLTDQPFQEWSKLQQDSQTPQKDKFAASIEIGKLLISALGTGATILGGYMLILNFRVANKQAEIANKQAKIAQTRLVTETFSKAVENLESDKPSVLLGAIYSLERIADSPQSYWMTIKILNALVRDKLPSVVFYEPLFNSENNLSEEELQKQKDVKYQMDYMYAIDRKPDTYIADILTILGKPNRYKEAFLHELGHIDLSRTELIGAQIVSADFRECHFYSTDLRCACIRNTNFEKAKLQKADFRWAEIYLTNFTKANLTDAKFNQAKLVETVFNEVNLSGVVFNQADLVSATFHYADLSGATFDGAKLSIVLEGKRVVKADFRRAKNLDPKKVKKALGWEQALYDDDFRQKLGLPAPDANT